MTKIHTTLSVEESVLKEAKSKFLNLSAELEKALKEKLGKKQVEIPEGLKCEFCGEGKADSWLWPDEKWICDSCLKRKATNVSKS